MSKKDVVLTAIIISLNMLGISGIILQEIGALYLWFQGKCYVYAYYYGSSYDEPVEGVRVTFTDYWGRSKVVVTEREAVNVTLYFHGWYSVEASYKNSTKTKVITTANAKYLYVGFIYVILEKNGTIRDIMYISPPKY
ncbi:TPA: hypothetical protein EYP70_02620 [Candidatus Bathyarchaeota archaeon]|nr:hypothetical protein [Candidatus Bathyarchaeota archaeon]